MPQWMFQSPKKRQFISFGYGTLQNDAKDEQASLCAEVTKQVGKRAVKTLKTQLKTYAFRKVKESLSRKKPK